MRRPLKANEKIIVIKLPSRYAVIALRSEWFAGEKTNYMLFVENWGYFYFVYHIFDGNVFFPTMVVYHAEL